MSSIKAVSYCIEAEKYLGLTLRDLPYALIEDARSFRIIMHLSILSGIGEAEIANLISPALMCDRDVYVSWRINAPNEIQIKTIGERYEKRIVHCI